MTCEIGAMDSRVRTRERSNHHYLGMAAMHSTSSFASARTSAATTTVERAGGSLGQNVEYTEFIPWNSLTSVRKTVHLTTLAIVLPPASTTALTFSSAVLVCS